MCLICMVMKKVGDKKRNVYILYILQIGRNNYDSVYLGNIELDDGSFLEDTPIIVLKEYNQQVPLTYHYIDKNKLGLIYEEQNKHYSIL